MAQRGRKGPLKSSTLSLVAPVPEPTPSPPEHLSAAAKDVWIELFDLHGVKPAQLAGGWHLVECYCNAVALARSYALEAQTAPTQKQRDEFALAMCVGLGKDRFQLIARRLP